MSDLGASIKIIPFHRKFTEWPMWSEKFLARANRREYQDILEGIINVPGEDETISEDDLEEVQKLRKLNELVYENLILSITGDTDT